MVQDTSVESLKTFEDTGNLGNCERIVYDFIKVNPGCSLKNICTGTGLLQENVCGRKKSLEEHGLIIKAGEKFNQETNRRVEVWKVNESGVKTPNINALSNREFKKVMELVSRANVYQKNKIAEWCK